MKINVSITLDRPELPIDWRRTILSLIKKVLQNESEETYNLFYKKGSTKMKNFTFWTLLRKPKFKKDDCIELEENNFTLLISTCETKLAFCLYNGLKKHTEAFNIFKGNAMHITKVRLEKEKTIRDSEIVVNMLSPLVVKKHFENQNDQYFLYNEEGFFEAFEQCVKAQLKSVDKVPKIIPIKCKKVIVKAYGTNIPASLGVFKLEGEVEVLTKLYQTGISAKNGAGFGKFDILV